MLGLAWKQTLPTTCGAAALMVALAERKGTALSSERELAIWRFANDGSAAIPGAFPGRLALLAHREGCRVEVFEDRAQLEAVLRLSADQTVFPGLDPVKGLEEHAVHLRAAETEGVPVTRGGLSLERVAELARGAQVLMLVSTAADVSGLHWVLLKGYDPDARACTLMDPALGRNLSGSLAGFVSHYRDTHPFLGVAVTIV
jgi:hypothetical protein